MAKTINPAVRFKALEGKNEFCQNPDCPNDHTISIAIFKGTGHCSADCMKVVEGTPPTGNMVFLTEAEERAVKAARNSGTPLGPRRGKFKGGARNG